jgi:non-specific serine/threonine protein kinase/serine/threonine-protein kinase
MNSFDDVSRWERMMGLLAEALDRPAAERQAFIDQACGSDGELRAKLLSLLAAAAVENSVLDAPASSMALEALEELGTRPWIGRRLGAYRLAELIGGGGMGQVYRAERVDGQFEQQAAVKLMREGLDRDSLLERFKAERQILANLDHPNLAKLLDGGITEEGIPYFVMELISGEPIDAYCQAHSLDLDERLRLFRTVCQVVHYAHQRGVVHRDLKPANILVTREGVVKLVDFGIAKLLAAPGVTATAQRRMTLDYASPEQVRGEAVTPASDIFSLGVVLYRLLADASPYPADTNDYELSKAICDTEPPLPSAGTDRLRSRRLRGDLDAVVMMALRKDPARRYRSAEALADDLFRHLEGLPVQARDGAWSYRAGRFVLRHKAMVGGALVANLALVGGIAFAGVKTYEAHVQKQRADQQRDRAERHFASVRKLAGTFMVDVDQAIGKVQGAEPARKVVVAKALEYLNDMSKQPGQSVPLRVELAAGYRRVGDILSGADSAALRDPAGALDSYGRATSLLEPSLDGADGAIVRKELAAGYTARAALLRSMGKAQEADALVERAARLQSNQGAAR